MVNSLKSLTFCLVFQMMCNLMFSQEANSVNINDSSYINKENKTERKSNYKFSDYSGIELSFGSSYLFDKEISEDFSWGVNAGLRFRFNMPNRKTSLIPLCNIRTYSYSLEGNSSAYNTLTIYKVGLQLSIRLINSKNDKLSIWSYFEINNSWLINYFTWEVNNPGYYSTSSGSNTRNESKSILKGQSISGMIGYRIRYGICFFEIGFDQYSSSMTLSNTLKNYYESKNIEYNPNSKFSANGLNINIGIYTPFSMMNNNLGFFKPNIW